MKFVYYLFFFTLLFSCTTREDLSEEIRQNFTNEELKIIALSKEIIKQTYYGTLITIDREGQSRARIMEPFEPDKNFIIWLATNPKSRKVSQLKENSSVTLHYFNKDNLEYVSLMGNAFLIDDDVIKSTKWKKGWERFYKNKKEDYMLIKFIPKTLEMISIANAYNGDSATWKPHQVILRE